MIEKNSQGNEKILIAFALLFICLRFIFLSYAPYITDEPATQMIADKFLASKQIPFTLFRGSQVHIPYGAGALWFYMFVRLFTWNPITIAYAHTLLFSTGFFFLYFAMKNSAGPRVAAWSLLFASSSPFLFDLSRHTWDVTFCVPFGGLLLWLISLLDSIRDDSIQSKNKSVIVIIAIAVVAAYLVNIHLMTVPLAAAAGLVVFTFLWKNNFLSKKERLQWALFYSVLFLVLLIPYIYFAWRRWIEEPMSSNVVKNKAWGDARNLWWLFLRTTLYSSLWSTKFYFDPYLQEFRSYCDPITAFFHKVDVFGWFAKVATYGYLIRKGIHLLKHKTSTYISLYAVLIFSIFLIMMQYSNIPTDAHHFLALWWIVFWASTRVRNILPGIWKRIFSGILLINILINISFCLYYLSFIRTNYGIRNQVISTALAVQMEKIDEGCRWMNQNGMNQAVWDLSHVPGVQHPFIYLTKHIPSCIGKSIVIAPWGDKNAQMSLMYALSLIHI